jgi:hypothetical protein
VIGVGEVESSRELEDLEGARLVEVGTVRVALEIHEAVSNTGVALPRLDDSSRDEGTRDEKSRQENGDDEGEG